MYGKEKKHFLGDRVNTQCIWFSKYESKTNEDKCGQNLRLHTRQIILIEMF